MSKKDYPKLEEAAHHSDQEWWDQISAEERQAIDAGLADIEAGHIISHNEMRKRYARLCSCNR